MDDYKKCPIKKRPIYYIQEEEQPQDLSMKRRKSEVMCEEKCVQNFPLNLSTDSLYDSLRAPKNFVYPHLESPSSTCSSYSSTGHESQPTTLYTQDYIIQPTIGRAYAPFNSTNTIWKPYCDDNGYDDRMTPPSSPESTPTEPEDLTQSDIPLLALLHVPQDVSSSNSASDYKNARYKCSSCSKMYSTEIGLSKHQQYHCPAADTNRSKKQYSCDECGKLYTSVGALKMHIRTHTLPCKCPICGKAFSRPWLLQGHIRTHTGEKPFSCTDCKRCFADRSNLRAHQQTHVDVKKYVCKICNKSFARMSLLNKHSNSNCTITIA